MGANENFPVPITSQILGGVKDIFRFSQTQARRVKKIWR